MSGKRSRPLEELDLGPGGFVNGSERVAPCGCCTKRIVMTRGDCPEHGNEVQLRRYFRKQREKREKT